MSLTSLVLGCLVAIQTLVALIAVPVSLVMIAFGDPEGWWVLLVATVFLVVISVQAWWTREVPDPWL